MAVSTLLLKYTYDLAGESLAEEPTMRVRIIYGKLKPGTWDAYETAYKEAMQRAGEIPGLRARWLTRDVANPDAGYSISLWEDKRRCKPMRGATC